MDSKIVGFAHRLGANLKMCMPSRSCPENQHSLCSPNEDFGRQNKRSSVRFRFGLRCLENCIENAQPTCCYDFQNLRLGSIKMEQRSAYVILNPFSMIRSPNRVLTPLKSTSNTHTQAFVRSSKIFVWGACSCYYFFESSCKVVTKDSSIPEKPTKNQRIACHYLL